MGLFLWPISESLAADKVTYNITEQLSKSQTWLGILDYKNKALEVKNQDYYLTDINNFNPQDELIATVKEYKNFNESNSSFFCKFPSRAYFIQENFKEIDEINLNGCSDYQSWSSKGEIDSISLLYVNGYLKNPASFFGHTLIKFNSSANLDTNFLLENTLNYGAETGDDAALPYVIKGMFGGYTAGLQNENFFRLSAQYQEFQMRDIYEYKLKLSKYQKNLIISYTFEMNRNRYNYYFLSDNCAYRMNRILGVGLNQEPMPNTPWKAPIDLLIGVNDLNIIDEIIYHPSQTTRTLSSINALTQEERNQFKELIKMPKNISKDDTKVSNNIKIALLETLNYKKLKEYKENNVEELRNIDNYRKNILLSIDTNDSFTKYKIKNNSVPHKINRPTLLSYSLEDNSILDNGFSIRLRGANFEFLDIDDTRLGNSEFVFLSPKISFYKNKLLLDEVILFKVLSLNDFKTNIPDEINFSWGIDVSRKQLSDSCYPCSVNQVKGSLGKAFFISDNLSIYNLANIMGHQSRLDSGNFSNSIELGAIYRYKKFKFLLKHENLNFAKSNNLETEENSIKIKYNLGYSYDFSIEYKKNKFNSSLSLNLNTYF